MCYSILFLNLCKFEQFQRITAAKMAIRVVFLACFLMSINLAVADIDAATLKCVIENLAGIMKITEIPTAGDMIAYAKVRNNK